MSTFSGSGPSDNVLTVAPATNLSLLASAVAAGTPNYQIPSYSDYLIIVNTSGAGQTITLPLAATCVGSRFRFVLGTATAGANVIILAGVAGAANIYGAVLNAGTHLACAGVSALNFVSGTALVGDSLEFQSDGTRFYVKGFAQIAASFTTTA